MNKKPRCKIETCNNDALLLVFGEWVCGDCYMTFHEQQQKTKWSSLVNSIQESKNATI